MSPTPSGDGQPSAPEFVRSGVVSVAVRPQRIAYAVDAADQGQAREAVTHASTEWGGIYHPIVAINGDSSISEGDRTVCELVRPDVLIDFGRNQSAAEGLARELSAAYLPCAPPNAKARSPRTAWSGLSTQVHAGIVRRM